MGTADDFATSFLHFSLFSTVLWDLKNSRPVHSLMLSSYLFLCLPCLHPPFTVPCKTMLPRRKSVPCQDPAGNRTTRRPDHCKETQTAVVWSCLPFIRSGQNHLARHSERGKNTRRTKEEVGRQHQGMDWPGVRQVPEGSGEQGKM